MTITIKLCTALVLCTTALLSARSTINTITRIRLLLQHTYYTRNRAQWEPGNAIAQREYQQARGEFFAEVERQRKAGASKEEITALFLAAQEEATQTPKNILEVPTTNVPEKNTELNQTVNHTILGKK